MTKIEQVLRFGNMPNPSEEALSIIERVKKIVLASTVVRFKMSTLQIERIKFAETSRSMALNLPSPIIKSW